MQPPDRAAETASTVKDLCYNPALTRQLAYEASAESEPMARTSSAAAGPTSATVQEWTRARPLSISVRHSTESEWRGMMAVV